MMELDKQLDQDEIVKETIEIYKEYRDNSARQLWATHLTEDEQFRFGKQWTDVQEQELAKRGQAAIVVNRIHPAVETAKALLTARKPGFKCSGREDSDTKVAKVMDGVLEYCWDVSQGHSQFRQIADDYYVKSMGYSFVYQDSFADNGKGEVKFMSLAPLDVFVDPNSRNRFFDDAENIIYSRLYTKEQAKKYKPFYASYLDNVAGDEFTDRPVTDRVDDGALITPEVSEITEDMTGEMVRGYERYQMVFVSQYRIFDSTNGKERVFSEKDFEEFRQQPVFLVGNQIYRDPKVVTQVVQMMTMKTGTAPKVQPATNDFLIKQKIIQVVRIKNKIIRVYSIMGETLLYVRDLPPNLHVYPIIPFPNLYTGTPFPTSDVRMVKGLQEYVNKLRSLILAHASTSTNVKVLLPKGSVDIDNFERMWARPGVGIEVDYDMGIPQPVNPVPLPNELYHNERQAKEDINHQFGIYEMQMGNTQAAPDTYKATISLDEYGQRKIRSKLADIEGSLQRTAQVMIAFIQQLYTEQKMIRIVNPNNSITEFMVNQRLYDDKTKEIKAIENNIAVGQYDVKILVGSTLPSNRYAELELHMSAYQNGLIDKQEVLKKTDIYDIEGVLQRFGEIAQLSGQLEQATEHIKKLEGDLQTKEREVIHAKREVILAKFGADIEAIKNKASAAGVLHEERLKDNEREFKKDLQRKVKQMDKNPE